MNNQVFEEVKTIAKYCNIVFSDNNDVEKCRQEFANKVNWNCISTFQKLSEEFIKEFANRVNWTYISADQNLSEEFIREFADKVNWYNVSIYQLLSEEFIREFSDKVYWYNISYYQKLSEEFIREFANKIRWSNISFYQKLSEEFIREFADKVDWYNVSAYQKLSESFIREFANKVNWNDISIFQKLSEEFIREHNLTISKYNWLYKTKESKLFYLKEHCNGIYEIVDDNYIIAYKSTRIDGHSTYNFQYQYEVNKTYEAHCDCNVGIDASFGLSAWTKEKALEYYSKGKLFKVYINIEDIGAIVHDNKKIRCSKLTVVSEESF